MAGIRHSTAVISAEARLDDSVSVGPYAVIEGPVELAAGCAIGPHCYFVGRVTVAANNRFHAGCVIGDHPQHLAYKGDETEVRIGTGNTFREHATVHRGMPANGGVTRIGDNSLFMVNSHVAHDCLVGNNVIFANGAVIGGHAEIQDGAFLSGNTAVHQFCRVGKLAMLAGTSAVSQDLPPFWVSQLVNIGMGVNVIGMRRAGIPAPEINAIRRAFKLIARSGKTIRDAVAEIEATDGHLPAVKYLVEFIRTTKKGIVTGDSKWVTDDD